MEANTFPLNVDIYGIKIETPVMSPINNPHRGVFSMPKLDSMTKSNGSAFPMPEVDSPTRSNGGAFPMSEVDSLTRSNVGAFPMPEVDSLIRSNGGAFPMSEVDSLTRSNGGAFPMSEVDSLTRSNGDAFPMPEVDSLIKSNSCAFPMSEVDSLTRSNGGTFPIPEVDSLTRSNSCAFPVSEVDSLTRSNVGTFPMTEVDSLPRSNGDAFPMSEVDSLTRSNGDAFPMPEVDSHTRSTRGTSMTEVDSPTKSNGVPSNMTKCAFNQPESSTGKQLMQATQSPTKETVSCSLSRQKQKLDPPSPTREALLCPTTQTKSEVSHEPPMVCIELPTSSRNPDCASEDPKKDNALETTSSNKTPHSAIEDDIDLLKKEQFTGYVCANVNPKETDLAKSGNLKATTSLGSNKEPAEEKQPVKSAISLPELIYHPIFRPQKAVPEIKVERVPRSKGYVDEGFLFEAYHCGVTEKKTDYYQSYKRPTTLEEYYSHNREFREAITFVAARARLDNIEAKNISGKTLSTVE